MILSFEFHRIQNLVLICDYQHIYMFFGFIIMVRFCMHSGHNWKFNHGEINDMYVANWA